MPEQEPPVTTHEANQRHELPTLALDPATLGDLDADLDREWLMTNGLGGYAMGSVCGATTRAYHGLLVAAVRPPVDRVVLVAKVDEVVSFGNGEAVALGTNEWASGATAPEGYRLLAGFALEGLVPCFTYRLAGDATLDKRIWMEQGHNLSYLQYRYNAPATAAPISLALTPFCLDRDHHGSTQGAADWRFLVDTDPGVPNACTIRALPGAAPYRLVGGPSAVFRPSGAWYTRLYHRAEHARGLPDSEDVYIPGAFTVELEPGETTTLVLSSGPDLPLRLAGLGGADHERIAAGSLDRERVRCAALLDRVDPALRRDTFASRLALAADQFLVTRSPAREPSAGAGAAPAGGDVSSLTVIAGYPWFTDWGRDTMIALPGLTLVTGRHAEARALLLTFAGYVDQGLIPNRFPDGDAPAEYNTADATLWLFHAVDRYLEATGDWDLLAKLFPVLDDIVSWHVRGTRYGIGVDPVDGLLRAGAPGLQLTWMDAKVGDWVVTPRRGKPVEINALWHAALAHMCAWARRSGREPGPYETQRAAVERSFLARFWYDAGGYLYDVVDVEGQAGMVDWSLRPNQLFALALAPQLVPAHHERSILGIVERELLTPLGLRTLAPEDPRFIGSYGGDQRSRDAAYHQGTVWPWLLGAYANACLHVYGSAERLPALLQPFRDHLRAAGIGTISEVASGAPPFLPGGCIAQAWSVAEVLRIAALCLAS
jgi:predicted glycogen debranching enzyme